MIINPTQWDKGLRVCWMPNAVWDIQEKRVVLSKDTLDAERFRPFACKTMTVRDQEGFKTFLDEKLETHYVVVYQWPKPLRDDLLIFRAGILDKNIW